MSGRALIGVLLAVAACADAGGDDDGADARGAIDGRVYDDGTRADAPHLADGPGVWLNETDAAAEADFCNVQFPATLLVIAGQPSEPIYTRIYEAGRTEAAGAPAGIVAQLGVGPEGSVPSDAGWTWVAAAYNVQTENNDEFTATITAPPSPGNFVYAARFSIDGAGFTACDLDGAGANEGLALDPGQLGQLTVIAP